MLFVKMNSGCDNPPFNNQTKYHLVEEIKNFNINIHYLEFNFALITKYFNFNVQIIKYILSRDMCPMDCGLNFNLC